MSASESSADRRGRAASAPLSVHHQAGAPGCRRRAARPLAKMRTEHRERGPRKEAPAAARTPHRGDPPLRAAGGSGLPCHSQKAHRSALRARHAHRQLGGRGNAESRRHCHRSGPGSPYIERWWIVTHQAIRGVSFCIHGGTATTSIGSQIEESLRRWSVQRVLDPGARELGAVDRAQGTSIKPATPDTARLRARSEAAVALMHAVQGPGENGTAVDFCLLPAGEHQFAKESDGGSRIEAEKDEPDRQRFARLSFLSGRLRIAGVIPPSAL